MANGSRHSMFAVKEVTNGVTPTDPALELVRITGTTLGLSKDSLQSEEIRSDRQISDYRQGSNQVGGDINFELSYGSFDELLQGVLVSDDWATDTPAPGTDQIKSGQVRSSFTFVRNFADIDTADNPYYIYRGVEINQMQLNVTANAKLEWIRCQRNNNLRIANIANGNNANMNVWDMKAAYLDQNPLLTCILVDANVQNNIPVQWQKDATASYALDDEIGYTDTNLKNELLNYTETIDLDANGKIGTCEAENYINTLVLNNKGIQNPAGLEAFKNITGLNLNDNDFPTLNVTNNTKLIYLYASNCKMVNVSITDLGMLDDLNVSKNNLSSISFSNNFNLTKVDVSENSLTGINLQSLNKLVLFDATSNNINSLNVLSNPNLEILYFANNSLVGLANQPIMIDLASNTKLKQLNVKNTAMSFLELGANSNLIEVIASDNVLEYFNMANANNAAISNFDASGNTTLGCIQVDSGFTPPTSWIKDGNTSYSDNCSTASVDDNLLKNKISLYPNPFSNLITISNSSSQKIEKIEIYNSLGKRLLFTKETTIDGYQLTTGVYYAKIYVDNSSFVKKLIKK